MSFRLLDLAEELVLAIAETTPISDLLSLRLTCRTLYKICDFPLQERRHRLYLHPRSLYYAIDVCSVPEWSRDITEIVILGNSEPTMTSRDSRQFPDCLLDYHPWSQFPPTADGERVLEYRELVDAESNSFARNYAALLSALEQLPRLRTIKYTGRAVEPGFCSVTAATIMAHAKQRDLWRLNFGNDDQPSMRAALRTVWWSDAEVFTYLLAHLHQRLSYVDIKQPMPAVKSRAYRPVFGIVSHMRMHCFSGVTSVRYTAPGPKGWTSFISELLANMPSLQNLQIDIVSSRYEELISRESSPAAASHPWEEDLDLSWNPSPIVCPSHSPFLQKITIRGPPRTPYSVAASGLISAMKPYADDQYNLSTNDVINFSDESGSIQKIVTVTLSPASGNPG